MRAALEKAVDGLRHDPYRARVKPTKQHRRLDAAAAQAVAKTFDGLPGVGEGVTGRAVKNIQARLKAAGYAPSRTDGTFDASTARAVRAFEKKHRLKVDGKISTRDLGAWSWSSVRPKTTTTT